MKRLHQLQNRQAAILKTLGDLSDKLAAEDREHTEEELATQNRLKAELDSLGPKIADEEKIQNQIKELANKPGATFHVGGPENHQLSDQVKKPDSIRIPVGYGTVKNFKGEDARLNAYKSGQFILASMGNAKSAQWCRDHGVEVLSQNEGTNTAGGYLVPPEMATAIIDLREQYGVFRRNCAKFPMSRDTLTINRRSGGLTAYWVAEEGAYTDSSKSWNQVDLVAKKLTALTYWSNELSEDSVLSLADDLANEMAYAFALKEDQCGFVGDGTSTYGGILGVINRFATGSYAGSVFQSPTAGHSLYSALTLSDFHGVTALLPLYARPRAKWYMSQAAFSTACERLMYAGGGNTVSTIGGGTGPSFLGFPVEISQVMNTTLTSQTSTYVLFFGDLSMAACMGTRRDITVDTSNQVRWTQDQMAIKASQRFDIVVHDTGSALAAGPVVCLETSSS